MRERELLAIVAAIIWASQRNALRDEAESSNGPDYGSIREAVEYAGDILVEVDESMKSDESRVVDAEIVDNEPVRRRR